MPVMLGKIDPNQCEVVMVIMEIMSSVGQYVGK